MQHKELSRNYEKLFDGVSSALFKADPIGINFGANTDEYSPEARTILPRLKSACSSQDVQLIVYEEFKRWFGDEVAGEEERYKVVSLQIWDLWLEFKRQEG